MRILRAAPTFVVADVARTGEWYVRELGFECAFFPAKPPYGFADLFRGGAELMLLRIEGYRKPALTRPEGLWDAYFRLEGVMELYRELRDKPYVVAPLTKRSHGDSEFEIEDPNGYRLVFGELIRSDLSA